MIAGKQMETQTFMTFASLLFGIKSQSKIVLFKSPKLNKLRLKTQTKKRIVRIHSNLSYYSPGYGNAKWLKLERAFFSG